MFKCNICKAKFTTTSGLTRHKAIHMAFRIPCRSCDSVYRYKKTFMKHMALKHKRVLDEAEITPVFYPDSMVWYSSPIFNSGKPAWTCKNCLGVMLSEDSTRAHVLKCTAVERKCPKKPQPSKSIPEPKVYKCPCCDETFHRKVVFDRHLEQMKAKASPSDVESD